MNVMWNDIDLGPYCAGVTTVPVGGGDESGRVERCRLSERVDTCNVLTVSDRRVGAAVVEHDYVEGAVWCNTLYLVDDDERAVVGELDDHARTGRRLGPSCHELKLPGRY